MAIKLKTPVFPLKRKDDSGDGNYDSYFIDDITDRSRLVDQNIKMVLLTNPGERLSEPNFGVGLSRYLFEFESQIEIGADYTIQRSSDVTNVLFEDPSIQIEERRLPPLRENIISQFSSYLPYILLKDLEIDVDGEKNSLRIIIKYYVDQDLSNQTFDYTIIDNGN
tara:strand:- start:570 stop:1067 length:498 start_codon:yes stop_codon:yes gene_type:complete